MLVLCLGRAHSTQIKSFHTTLLMCGAGRALGVSRRSSRFRSLPKHSRQQLRSFCHSQLMPMGMQRATWQRWSFSQPHQGKRINRYQTLSKGTCAKTIKCSCTSHPSWQDHTPEKAINTAPKPPQGFSRPTLGHSLHCSSSCVLGRGGLWKTFQACLDDQRDRKTGVYLSSTPSAVPGTPTCTPADLQSSSFAGLKITVPIPLGVSSHPPRSQGLTDTTPGHFVPWMEDSHLLPELPARSAKEENPLLAHAWRGIVVPHGPHKSWWLWEPLPWDKQGRVALWTWHKVVEHFPTHQTRVF